jgi:amidohydrolase
MNSKTQPDFGEAIRRRLDPMVALRRDFHRHAELSFQERRTADVIATRLRQAGLEVRTGIAGTGVVGILAGEKSGRTVMYRADIDALPLEETKDRPYASENAGAMHACGHDGHTAIAIMLAEVLAERRRELPGTVVFCFQPAEETMGGAKPMIAAGVLENPRVDCVLGLHLINQIPTGKVVVRPGPSFAAADFLRVEITGKGGHGAMPHLSVDPITVAAHIIVGMQELVAREVSALETAVMTIGQVIAGTKNNIIPDKAELRGTLRTFSAKVRHQLIERMGTFVSHIAGAYRAQARLIVEGGIPAVDNHGEMTDRVNKSAIRAIGAENVIEGELLMGSDDMCYFLQERPGCYYQVGAALPDREMMPHHHPGFDLDERSLEVGLRVSLQAILDALGK